MPSELSKESSSSSDVRGAAEKRREWGGGGWRERGMREREMLGGEESRGSEGGERERRWTEYNGYIQ